VNSQTGGVVPFQPGAVPFPQPGGQINGVQGTFAPGGAAPPNPAMNLINQIITTPRGNPSAVPTGAATTNTSQFGQGGIAGFASTFNGTGIKVYKERKKYQEWEFVFDLKELLGQQQTGLPQNNNPLGRPGSGGGQGGGQGSGQGRGSQSGSGSNNGFTFGGGGSTPTNPRP